jgi:MFS family permease
MSRDLLLIIISLFTWGVGEGMFIYFQPLYLQQWGAAPLAIGAILGASGIAMTVAQAPAGYLSDRIGTRPVMWASWILGTGAAWFMALAGSIDLFSIGLIIYGLTSFVLAPMNSYITGARGKWSVGRAITVTGGFFQLGSVIGPLVGGAIGQSYGLKTVYVIGASILAISTLIILFVRPQPVHTEVHAAGRGRLLRDGRFVTFICIMFVAVFATYLPQPLTANFLQNQRGLPLVAIGQLGSLTSLGNALLSLGLGHLNAGIVFLVGQVLVAVFSLLLWKGTGMLWYGIGSFFFAGYRLCRSMSIALTRPLVEHSEIGLAYGLLETANAGSLILAPLVAGALYQIDPTTIYPVSIGLLAITFCVSAWYLFGSRHSPGRVTEPVEVELVELR